MTQGQKVPHESDMLDAIAAGLYSLASMLIGEGEESVELVETAVATAEVSSFL